MPSPKGTARYILCLVTGVIISGTSLPAQPKEDPDKITDQEFLRLLQQSDQLNKEQKQRARRTKNPRVLVPLAEDEDPGVRFYVAFNPYTPATSLGRLAKDPNSTVRWGVARNSRFLFDIDTSFVKDLDEGGGALVELGRAFGRMGIFLTNSTEIETVRPGVFWKIADRFQSYEVRKRRLGLMVYNEPTPNPVLEIMAEDYAEVVRVGLASNPNGSPGILRLLHDDVSPTVRRHVAENENTDPTTLEVLSKDEERPVRLAVAGNLFAPLQVLADFSVDSDESIRIEVAVNPGCSPALLLGMIFDTSIEVRRGIAAHPNLPEPGITKLANDSSLEVRQAVINNVNTVPEALRQLSFDADQGIRDVARTRLASILRDRISVDRER